MKKFWCLSNPPGRDVPPGPVIWKLVAWDGTITGFLGEKVSPLGKPTLSNRTLKLSYFIPFEEKWTAQALYGRRLMSEKWTTLMPTSHDGGE